MIYTYCGDLAWSTRAGKRGLGSTSRARGTGQHRRRGYSGSGALPPPQPSAAAPAGRRGRARGRGAPAPQARPRSACPAQRTAAARGLQRTAPAEGAMRGRSGPHWFTTVAPHANARRLVPAARARRGKGYGGEGPTVSRRPAAAVHGASLVRPAPGGQLVLHDEHQEMRQRQLRPKHLRSTRGTTAVRAAACWRWRWRWRCGAGASAVAWRCGIGASAVALAL